MLISVVSFGSLWSRRVARAQKDPAHFTMVDAAYYNTTGMLVGDKIRNRPRVYGVARFNAVSGVRPDWTGRMIFKVFDCEPPCLWNGHNKVLFKRLLSSPAKPDAYLVTATAEQSGWIDKDNAGPWLCPDAALISFSQCLGQQEVMVVMPAYAWLRGALGAFFLEPSEQKPWEARLVLSQRD